MLEALFEAPRPLKRAVCLAYDTLAIVIAFYLAIFLRLSTFDSPFIEQHATVLAITLVLSLAVFIRLGMYRAILRYLSTAAMLTIVGCVFLSSLILASTSFLTDSTLPRSIPFIYLTIALLLIGAPRLLVRSVLSLINRHQVGSREPVIVYGAGYTGHQLTLALMGSSYQPVAFVDDNASLHGTVVSNIKVHDPDKLDYLIRVHGTRKILLALGNTPNSRRAKVLKRLESLAVSVQTVPAISDILSGKARIEHIRDVDIEDLLGRDPVPSQDELMSACITGKVVMITGAGGSIGGELCRQILPQGPKAMVLFELNEYSLYRIERELRELPEQEQLQVKLYSILGSVQKEHRVETIMRSFGVETVYHAAAYKHVPLVEHNIVEGVRNNVYGTWYTAEAAIRAGVETFVLVSTDKAVRPTNVMGASKRMAELVLQGLAKRQTDTVFSMVRFGNVLGSSGSVVPLFRSQIKQGGPVTVTHPDMTRYFMTIPEAAKLVVQASAVSTGGDVFVLDMGEPIKIVDLARRMIHLSGLEIKDEDHPEGDIAISYTGLRPGEKLYEELLVDNNVSGTRHNSILRAEEDHLDWEQTQAFLEELDKACHSYQCERVRALLVKAPTGYKASIDISDAVWLQKQTTGSHLKIVT